MGRDFRIPSKPSLLLLVILLAAPALIQSPLRAAASYLQGPTGIASHNSPHISGAGVSIIRSDEKGIIFEVTPSKPEFDRVETQAGPFQQVRLPGYGHLDQPGLPDLPQRGFLVALPPGAKPILSLLESETYQVDDVNVLPAAQQELRNFNVDDLEGVPEFVVGYPADAAFYQSEALFPDSPISLGEQQSLRDQRVAQVIVRPVLANMARHSLTVYSRMRIEVRFDFPNGLTEPGRARPEGEAFEEILQNSLLNYETSRSWRVVPESSASPQASPCMDDNAFRITLDQTGMYAVSYAALVAADPNLPVSISSSNLRMCYRDQQIAIRVDDGGDGTFNSSDSVIFYGQSVKTQETETNVYWLTYCNSSCGGATMSVVTDSSAGSTPSYYLPTLHLETDAKYYSRIPTADLNDHWYWREPIVGSSSHPLQQLDISFTVTDKAPGTYNIPIHIKFWGWLADEVHPFEVRLNGNSIGTGQFTGAGHLSNVSYLYQGSAPSSALLEGTNMLSVIALDNDSNPTNPPPVTLLDWVEVFPRRQFSAAGNRLAFTHGSSGSYTYSVGNFGGASIVEIYDVTDPYNPTYQSKTAAAGTLSFHRTQSGPASYELTTVAALRIPLSIEKDSLPGTPLGSSSNTADYIIITDPTLNSALTPLRNRRSSQGLQVRTVFVQDIFDEFNYGIYSTQAIHDFLELAYTSWGGDREYVLLAGEGSYDHRNVLGGNGPGDNLVPVYLRSGIDFYLGEAAADNQYVDFNGDDLPEFLLGRLPAQNTAELSTMVSKILTYETNGTDFSWQLDHLFVADNGFVPPACGQDASGEFFGVVDNFLASHFPIGYIARRLYYAPSPCYPNPAYPTIANYFALSLGEMQSRLVQEYNQGNQFVVYTGHSGTKIWGHEQFLTVDMAAAMTNGNRTPIHLPMTCLEGIYHFPEGDNLSETLLKNSGGGAVASYAPTGLQVQTGHDYLLNGFYESVFVNNERILGQAVYGAKSNLKLNGSSGVQDLHDTFMLLGDPAMQLNLPSGLLTTFLPITLNP